jgi:hypothetical protein
MKSRCVEQVSIARHPNGHGKCAAPDNETCYARFPLSKSPTLRSPPAHTGERANESLREFHVKGYKNLSEVNRAPCEHFCRWPIERVVLGRQPLAATAYPLRQEVNP